MDPSSCLCRFREEVPEGAGAWTWARHDIDELIATLEKFERGEIGPDRIESIALMKYD